MSSISHIDIDVGTKTNRFGPLMFVRGAFSHRKDKPLRHYWIGLRVPFIGVVLLSFGKWKFHLCITEA